MIHEDVDHESAVLTMKGGKITGRLLAKAMSAALRQLRKSRDAPGKKSFKQLSKGGSLQNIEITDGNIKSFEKVARKYGIDFALKKDASTQSPRYLVFFKSKDADALTAAFREYSGKVVKSQSKEKPSIRKQLSKLQEVVKDMAKSLSRNKSQEVDR